MVRFNTLKPYTTHVVACGRDATIVKTTAPAVSILKSPKLFCAPTTWALRSAGRLRRHLRPCHKEQRWRDRVESLVLGAAPDGRSTNALNSSRIAGSLRRRAFSADDKA